MYGRYPVTVSSIACVLLTDHCSSTPHAASLSPVHNSNIEHPHVEEELDIEVSGRVEDIDVTNFTPSTMRRMREWLYGVAEPSLKFIDRFSFIQYYLPKYNTAA